MLLGNPSVIIPWPVSAWLSAQHGATLSSMFVIVRGISALFTSTVNPPKLTLEMKSFEVPEIGSDPKRTLVPRGDAFLPSRSTPFFVTGQMDKKSLLLFDDVIVATKDKPSPVSTRSVRI